MKKQWVFKICSENEEIMNRKKPLLAYNQTDPIRLECKIDLDRLFKAEKERERFDGG